MADQEGVLPYTRDEEFDELRDTVLPYTRDEDFDELRDKDETTELIGYVDEVHAPTVVGSKAKYDLFKFILNNGSTKRIVCLVWGKNLIQKYVGEITVGRIFHIEGAVTKAVLLSYYKAANNHFPFELLIKDGTTVSYLGERDNLEIDSPNNEIPTINFEEVGKSQGLIAIEGFIKIKFFKAENKFKPEVYGCGAITDGEYKLTVHVTNYTEINLEKGVCVKVVGEVQVSGGGPVTIICRDANSIIEVEGALRMSITDVSRGVKVPKRVRE